MRERSHDACQSIRASCRLGVVLLASVDCMSMNPPDLFLLVCRTLADIILSGQLSPIDSMLDKCQICGVVVCITASGQKRRRESPGAVVVVCNPCGLEQVQEHDTAELQIGSPECVEGLQRSEHARMLLAQFLKGKNK